MNSYTFHLEGLGRDASASALTERGARHAVLRKLSNDDRDRLVQMQCIGVEDVGCAAAQDLLVAAKKADEALAALVTAHRPAVTENPLLAHVLTGLIGHAKTLSYELNRVVTATRPEFENHHMAVR